jgi:hypothetical protein
MKYISYHNNHNKNMYETCIVLQNILYQYEISEYNKLASINFHYNSFRISKFEILSFSKCIQD